MPREAESSLRSLASRVATRPQRVISFPPFRSHPGAETQKPETNHGWLKQATTRNPSLLSRRPRESRLHNPMSGCVINAACVERLNATFRRRITALVRRGRVLARQTTTLHQMICLVGTAYNLHTYHRSLRVPVCLPHGRQCQQRRRPAITAGVV